MALDQAQYPCLGAGCEACSGRVMPSFFIRNLNVLGWRFR